MKIVSIDLASSLKDLERIFTSDSVVNISSNDMDNSLSNEFDVAVFNPLNELSLKNTYLFFRNKFQKKSLIIKKNFSSKLLDILESDRNTYFVNDLNELDSLKERISELEETQDGDYHPIPLRTLMLAKESPVDIYLKLSNKRLIKVIRKGTTDIDEVLVKYEQKSCHYVYVKNDDFSKIVEFFSGKNDLLSIREIPEAFQKSFHKDTFEFVYYSLHMIGLNEETFKTTNRHIKNALHLVKTSSKDSMKDIWKSYCKNKNYLIEHSLILSHIVSGAIKFYDGNHSLGEKLLLASMFHDIALTDDMIAKTFGSKSEKEYYHWKDMEYFETHQDVAIKFLDSMNGIPGDVVTIIHQHHEKYDGSGFPRGLAGKNINVLSVFFIVCHEFVQELYINGYSLVNRNRILKELKDKYYEGYFSLAVEALSQLFNQDETPKSKIMVS